VKNDILLTNLANLNKMEQLIKIYRFEKPVKTKFKISRNNENTSMPKIKLKVYYCL